MALPIVLIACAMMTTVALAASAAFRASTRATSLFTQEVAVEELGRAGVDLAVATMASLGERGRLRGEAELALDGGRVAIAYASERGRADINTAPAELLEILFEGVGISPPQARMAAQAIAAWRGDVAKQTPAARAGMADTPVKQRFGSLPELFLTPGMTPELYARIEPLLSPCAGQTINPLIADRAMLATLLGDAAQAETYIAERGARVGADGNTPQAFPPAVRPYIATDGRPGDGVRLSIEARFAGLDRRYAAIACAPDSDPASLAVVAWRQLGL